MRIEAARYFTSVEQCIMDNDPLTNDQQTAGDIDAFLSGETFAVVGASTHREKYGNKVLRVYQQQGKTVYPINPRASVIEGLTAYPDLGSLPELPHGVSIITPPAITEKVVEEAVSLGVKHLWMQPGAESAKAVSYARENGVNVVAYGACVLVVLGYRER